MKFFCFPLSYLAFISFALLISCSDKETDNLFTATAEPAEEVAATTRFDKLAPEKTGITFAQTMSETFKFNFLDDAYVYNGGGVAVLDFNNDSLQDLFFISRQMECKLYRNKGDLTFEDVTAKGGVACARGLKTGASVVDINADGWQDLYVCRTGQQANTERSNILFINQGNDAKGEWSGFLDKTQEYGLLEIRASQHANFFDYDLDGDLDVYVLNQPVDHTNTQTLDFTPSGGRTAAMQTPRNESDSDRLFRNDDGKFKDVSKAAGISNRAWGLSVITTDLNDDGYPDVYIGNDFVMPDFCYINNRNGTFTNKGGEYFRHHSLHTMGVDIADINNDALPDIAALDMLADPLDRRKRLQNAMVNDRYDLMVSQTYGHQIMRNTLQINNGNNTFSDIACLAGVFATDWSWAVLLADYDNDGWKDLFISNGIRRDVNDQDFLSYAIDSLNKSGGIGPLTFKTYDDFAGMVPSQKVHNYLYQNQNGYQFKDVSAAWGFTDLKFSNGAAYADLDNDGDLDIASNNVDEPAAIYENKATDLNQNNWVQVKCKGTALNPTGVGAKIWAYCGDDVYYQEMTPIRGFFSSVEPIFQIGLGNHTSIDRLEVQWLEGKYQILKDVPAKQRIYLDIAKATSGALPKNPQATNTVFKEMTASESGLDFKHSENSFDDYDRERLLPHRLSHLGPALAVGDVDGNGMDDVYIGGGSGQARALYLQNAQGLFMITNQPGIANDIRCEDIAAIFFDADGDKDMDLFVVSGGNELNTNDPAYGDRLYFNNGSGGFASKQNTFPAETSSGGCVAVHDYDSDGDLDLVTGGRLVPGQYPQPGKSAIYQNEGGVFTDVTENVAKAFGTCGMVTDIAFADLDGDSVAEMIVCGEWMAITIYQYASGSYTDVTSAFNLQDSDGWWNSVLPVDIDKDGDVDLVAGNVGLNTIFKPIPGAPMKIFADDFDGNGQIDPITTVAIGSDYYPIHYRDKLVQQVTPSYVKKKYTRNASYSQAKITDIFSSSDLKDALHLEARTFATTLWENQNGKFIAKALPIEAQVAPVKDILAEDFNKDGHMDLLLVGNDYGNEIETGRLDASNGCLLIGDGKGGFTCGPNREHGLWASHDARRAAMVKSKDGSKLIVVANNGEKVQVFRVL